MKNYILKLCKWLLPTDQNILNNKHGILNQLFNSEFQELTTKQSIDLFLEVKEDFEKELQKRLIQAEQEINNITQYFDGQ